MNCFELICLSMVAILCQCASNETMAIRGRGTRHHGAAMVMKELLAARQKGKIETMSACIQTRSLFCSGLRCCALLLRAACIQTRSLFCSDLRCCALLLRAAAARYLHSDTVAILLGFALLLRAAAARCLHSDTVAILLGFALHRPRATTHRCSRAPPVQKMAQVAGHAFYVASGRVRVDCTLAGCRWIHTCLLAKCQGVLLRVGCHHAAS